MWTMANRIVPQMKPRLNSIYNQPFEQMKKSNQNINKINVKYEGNPIKQIKNINDGQIHNSPFHFGVNLYFGNSKSSFTPIHQNDNYFYPHHNEPRQNTPICLLFKSSLEKSGYKLSPEQTVQYKDIYKKYNSINSFYDDINCYYFPIRDFPMNSNNNIINNIYPTFTKVTNVQILPENDNNTNKAYINNKNKSNNLNNFNSNDLDNKKKIIVEDKNKIEKKNKITIINQDKENIKNNNNNNNSNINSIANDNEPNESKKQKILFECFESNFNSPLSSKNLLKKKRLRKNNEQLGLLSKFYMENKNWSKKQIKEISESIGLKENKIYKWLWDQKNKEYKVTKFVINKD